MVRIPCRPCRLPITRAKRRGPTTSRSVRTGRRRSSSTPRNRSRGATGPLAWALRIVGLVAVAVISGFVWWYIQSEGTGRGGHRRRRRETQQQSSGEYDFTAELDSPKVDDDVRRPRLRQDPRRSSPENPCSSSPARCSPPPSTAAPSTPRCRSWSCDDEEAAGDLRELTDTDGTGNVNDLVREGVVRSTGWRR